MEQTLNTASFPICVIKAHRGKEQLMEGNCFTFCQSFLWSLLFTQLNLVSSLFTTVNILQRKSHFLPRLMHEQECTQLLKLSPPLVHSYQIRSSLEQSIKFYDDKHSAGSQGPPDR